MSLSEVPAAIEWAKQVEAAFRELQSSYGLYQSAEYRAVLRHDPGSDSWLNILGKVQFRKEPTESGQGRLDFLVDPHTYSLRVPLTTEGALTFLHGIASGSNRLAVGNRQLNVLLTDKPEEPPSRFAPENHPMGRYDTRYGVDYSIATFALGIRDLLARVGVPQENLAPLGMHALTQLLHFHVIEPGGAIPTNVYTRPEAGLVAVLPFFHARFREISMDKNVVTVSVDLPEGVPAKDFRLVIKTSHYGGSDGFGDHGERPLIYAPLPGPVVRHEFPSTVRSAYAELYWEKAKSGVLKKIDSEHAKRPGRSENPQLTVYQLFDPDLRVLKAKLKGERQKDDQIAFEWAVAHLFSLAGFHIAWLGYLRGSLKERDIDIVAWEPEKKWLLLGECTIKGANVDQKLVDLADKTAGLSEEFDGWTIKKVLFTNIAGEALKGKQDKAAREKSIILVAAEAIEELSKLVEAGHPGEGIWYGLRSDLISYPSFLKQ